MLNRDQSLRGLVNEMGRQSQMAKVRREEEASA